MRKYRAEIAAALLGPYLGGSALAFAFSWPFPQQVLILSATALVTAALGAEALFLTEIQVDDSDDTGLVSGLVVSTALLLPSVDRVIVGIGLLPTSLWLPLSALGAGLLGAGACLRLAARRALGSRFTHSIQLVPEHELVEHGPYRLVRHPAYLGTMLALLGASLLFGSWLAILVVGACAPLGMARIRREERMLRHRFGDDFSDYARRVPAVVPFS